jgi:hypothetical protein
LLGLPLALAACGPTSSIDRELLGMPIGGAMRGTGGSGSPAAPPAEEPAKMPSSLEPMAAGNAPDAGSDPGTPDAEAEPTPDAAVVDTAPPPPPLSDAQASGCDQAVPWQAGGTYLGGEKVVHVGHLFECRSWPAAPWCALPAYEPASAEGFWMDAWIDRGKCE